MMNMWTVLTLSGITASAGCFGAPLDQPILRAQFGGNARRVVAPDPAAAHVTRTAAAREASKPFENAYTGAMQFSLHPLRHLYVGVELEGGSLSQRGSSFAAAYSVAGIEVNSVHTGLAIEMIAGRQWLRSDFVDDLVGVNAVEPRVRFQYLVDPQLAVGAMAGASAFAEERVWTAGVYIGVYSQPVDGS